MHENMDPKKLTTSGEQIIKKNLTTFFNLILATCTHIAYDKVHNRDTTFGPGTNVVPVRPLQYPTINKVYSLRFCVQKQLTHNSLKLPRIMAVDCQPTLAHNFAIFLRIIKTKTSRFNVKLSNTSRIWLISTWSNRI